MKNIISRETTRVKRAAQWLFLLVDFVISPALMAQQNAATLDHIQSSSILNVGYRQLPLLSLTNHDGEVMDYTIAVCNMIVDKLRQYLKLNNLTIYYIPMNLSERLFTSNLRKTDMDCGVDTNAPERASSVSFSGNYYIVKVCTISLRKDNTQSIVDLKGRTASLTGSSEDLLEFNKANGEQHLNVSTITSTIIKGAFEKATHNESAVFFINDILA